MTWRFHRKGIADDQARLRVSEVATTVPTPKDFEQVRAQPAGKAAFSLPTLQIPVETTRKRSEQSYWGFYFELPPFSLPTRQIPVERTPDPDLHKLPTVAYNHLVG